MLEERVVKAVNRVLAVGLAALAALPWLTGCGSNPEQTAQQKANAEATVIIAQAEATAIVLRAQATARALLSVEDEPDDYADEPVYAPTAIAEDEAERTPEAALPVDPDVGAEDAPQSVDAPTPEVVPASADPEVLQVGFGSDGALISVAYKAAPAVARKWMQGTVYLTDEKSGEKYGEVPVMPKVGPLLGRPKEYGQVAYIMFVNGPVPLQAGDVVTVVLGDYKQEHVKVR
jgi:hypothetical protein